MGEKQKHEEQNNEKFNMRRKVKRRKAR